MRRACRYRQNKSDDWRSGWLLGWAGLSEYPNAIIETEDGEVVLLNFSDASPSISTRITRDTLSLPVGIEARGRDDGGT